MVTLETDQGLALTRMVVIDNMKEVRALSKSITMEGGRGDMTRNVQRFSPQIEASGRWPLLKLPWPTLTLISPLAINLAMLVILRWQAQL